MPTLAERQAKKAAADAAAAAANATPLAPAYVNPNDPTGGGAFTTGLGLASTAQTQQQGAPLSAGNAWLAGTQAAGQTAAATNYPVNPNPYVPAAPPPQATNATNQQYGTDLSWLDPSFQENPVMLGQSQGAQTYQDPALVAQQQNAANQYQGYVGNQMAFQGSGQQQGLYNQYGAIAAGQGAPQFMGNGQQNALVGQIGALQAPTGASDAQQQSVYSGIGNIAAPQWGSQEQENDAYNGIDAIAAPAWDRQNANNQMAAYAQLSALSTSQMQNSYDQLAQRANGVGAPEFMDGTQQQGVADRFGSIAASGGSQGLSLDNGQNQQDQLNNMKEIIAGGGDTAIEAAARQSQRADQEQWLSSQRGADQNAYAQRGLTGSGQELLTLGADRQAAAGRNSLADLQTASALEARRDATINSAAGLSGTMRDQTNAAQEYQATRGDAALGAQGDMVNALRNNDFQNKSYLDSSALQAMGLSANEANAINSADLNKYNSMANVASTARGQTFNEQSFDAQNSLAKIAQQSQIAETARGQTDSEQSFQAQNSLAKLQAQGALATDMRGQTDAEQQFSAGYNLDKLNSQANIVGTERSQDYNELTYNDSRAINALGAQAQLSQDMRSDTYQEQMGQRSSDLNALAGYSNQTNQMASNQLQAAQFRAQSADSFSQLNQSAANSAIADNANFLQNSYQSMMNNRQAWEMNALNQGVASAGSLAAFDQSENQGAYQAGAGLATQSAGEYNNAQGQYNSTVAGANGTTAAQQFGAQSTYNTQTYGQLGQVAGKYADTIGSMASGAGGEAGGGEAGEAGTNFGVGTENGPAQAGGVQPNPYDPSIGSAGSKRYY